MVLTKKEERVFFILGIYFVLLELIFLVSFIWTKAYTTFFWGCNIIPLFFAFAFLTKNVQLIKGAINFEFLPQLVFMFLAILYFTTGISLLNINHSFEVFAWGAIALILHLFSANVALFYTAKIKTEKKSLFYGFLIFIIIFVLTFLFTPKSQNVNFLYSSKIVLGFSIPNLTIVWPFLVFLVIVIPTYLLQRFISNKN